MTLLSHIDAKKGNYDEGIWSVDHIMPAKDCGIFVGKEPYSGYLVRLVKYKGDIEENVGVKYLLIDEDLYPEKINFGNAYYIHKGVMETIIVTFNGDEYPIYHIVEPPEANTSVDEIMDKNIQEYLGETSGHDNSHEGSSDAKHLSIDRGREIWASIYVHRVGQGDTIVLELPNNQIWMVDAYFWSQDRRNRFDRWMLKKFKKKKIDRLIISHFHYDHIRSVPYIIQNYSPEQVVVTDSLKHRTSSVVRALHYAGDHLHVLPGEEITRLGSLQIQLHRTDRFSAVGNRRNPNDHEISVMLKSENGFAFLAGDLPGNMCDDLLANPFCQGIENSKNMIYKVSHHGSKTG